MFKNYIGILVKLNCSIDSNRIQDIWEYLSNQTHIEVKEFGGSLMLLRKSNVKQCNVHVSDLRIKSQDVVFNEVPTLHLYRM